MFYTPHLCIGIGEKSNFFTLRETYMHEYVSGGHAYREVRSFHHFNLSQDPDEAVTKAQDCAKSMGLILQADAATLAAQIQDIRRASAAELEQRAQQRLLLEQQWAHEREEKAAERLEQLEAGMCSFGQHKGKAFDKISRHYLAWMLSRRDAIQAGCYPGGMRSRLAH